MKKALVLVLALFLLLGLTACGGSEGSNKETKPTESTAGSDSSNTEDLQFKELGENQYYYATIQIVDYGTIKVQLDHTKAPITVRNFVNLAQGGFYDGLTFHRIIQGFMMQGGGSASPDKAASPIVGEFSSNGYTYNTISHKRGVISMARVGSNNNSATSQFFIMHLTDTRLDGKYAAFGYVVEGMDVVDLVCESARPTDGNGSIAPAKQPVIETITITIETQDDNSSDAEDLPFKELEENQYYYATMEVDGYGTIKVQLDHTKAPITVRNFVNLAQSGFYDGLTFHRIIEGFMMQGGRTNTPEKMPASIVGEFFANGYTYNTISHQRGVISMARSNNPNSASFQFFIMHETNTNLDGYYAAFGYVVEGMDVVDTICSTAEPTDDNGSIDYLSQPIMETITITIETIS